jgi:hypothetical protein
MVESLNPPTLPEPDIIAAEAAKNLNHSLLGTQSAAV